MTQFARPNADLHSGEWSGSPDETDLFENINDESPDDDSFVLSELDPDSSPYVTKLSNLEDPEINTGHTIRYRYRKGLDNDAQINLTVQLREDYESEGSPGTLIKEQTHTNISNSFTDGSVTLSTGEAESITDYEDLSLRFVATQV